MPLHELAGSGVTAWGVAILAMVSIGVVLSVLVGLLSRKWERRKLRLSLVLAPVAIAMVVSVYPIVLMIDHPHQARTANADHVAGAFRLDEIDPEALDRVLSAGGNDRDPARVARMTSDLLVIETLEGEEVQPGARSQEDFPSRTPWAWPF